MKIHTIVSMEMGMTSDAHTFKSKKSVRKYLEQYNKDNDYRDGNDFVDEVIDSGYYSDNNGYEVFYITTDLED